MNRSSFDAGSREGDTRKKQREVDNPYLAHLQSGRRNRTDLDQSLVRRRRKDVKAFAFHDEDETSQEELVEVKPLPENGNVPHSRPERNEASSHVVNLPMLNLETPGMEWWDIAFLPKELRDESRLWNPETAPFHQLSVANQKSTLFIEHPVPTKALMDSDEPLKLYQTKAELKRIRRMNRAQLNKEMRDKIALGLVAPPPPKVRISNLLRVLSTEHAADPSAIEARVKEEMELRERQHMARNLARKLTPEERLAKVRRRVEKDAQSPLVHFAVFRITNMEIMQEQLAKKRMVKMLLNARKLMVNGRVLVVRAPTSVPTMVFVEGGPKSMRKFIKLMLRRIDWKAKTILEAAVSRMHALEEDESNDHDDSSSSSSSSSSMSDISESVDMEKAPSATASQSQPRPGVRASCKLVWKATSLRREYDGFMRQVFDSELDARQFLQAKNLVYLWDAVASASDHDDNPSLQDL